MSELVLGIDTIGRGGAVALADAGRVIGIEAHDPELGYAEELFGLFDRLFEATGRTKSELTGIAVLSGPGSFTGLRIGVMTAKTLAFSLELPLLAAPTLDVLAASQGSGRRTAVVDAGGGHVWAGTFEVGDDVTAVVPVRRMAVAELEGEFVSVPPLEIGTPVAGLAGHLALLAAASAPPLVEVDPVALVPEYVSVSQAERVHGVDLSDELRRPIEPRGWSS